jgi:hypothetical protein
LRLIEAPAWCAASSLLNSLLAYWQPRSEWCSNPGAGRCFFQAFCQARTTFAVSSESEVFHPATLRVRSRSARPSGQPSVALSRACPGARLSKKEKESGLTPDYHYLTPEGAHFREILRCSLAQSNKYKLMRF